MYSGNVMKYSNNISENSKYFVSYFKTMFLQIPQFIWAFRMKALSALGRAIWFNEHGLKLTNNILPSGFSEVIDKYICITEVYIDTFYSVKNAQIRPIKIIYILI